MSGLTCCKQRRAGRKPVNANPGLKFNRIITFSFVQSFFTAFVLRILLSLKFKTQKQCVVPENIHTPPTEGHGISKG